MSNMDIILSEIGWVRSPVSGPREDFWGDVVSEIHLDKNKFTPEALRGLNEFSHVEVLFYLSAVGKESVITGSRRPRGNPNWPEVGIFAQRGKARPNRIAATICRLLGVESLALKVQGLDALDGSPVLDIKPVFAEFTPERAAIQQPKWSHEMMRDYFASGNS
jgi:tRNA-Thr(GGU) m(6)t(6)A37 methyltransferase TsaA